MNREPLQNGTILRFPDGQEHEIVALLGGGGSALLYETKILGSELYAAVKEIYPARGYVRKNGQICPSVPLPRRERELAQRKQSLELQETRLSQKASRKNHQILFLQPPVWHTADIRLPDETEYLNVENTYAQMDSLAGKGISLSQLVQEKRPSLDEAIQIMSTVLDAYAALHEDGFLHGDCQTSNLFLLRAGGHGAGSACILDFGSAREMEADGFTAPVADEIFSTDGYCAPELMFRQEGELRLSAAADVWSLGFLLLNLLTDRGYDKIGEKTKYLVLHPEEKVLTDQETTALGCTPAQKYLLNDLLSNALANEPIYRRANAGVMREQLNLLIRCRAKDFSKGLSPFLLWDAAWRYQQENPSLFWTEHQSRLADGRIPRRLVIEGRREGQAVALESATAILHDQAQLKRNTYLYGAGGAGKSFSVAPLVALWMESGERVPLYLDLASFTEEILDLCGGDAQRVIPTLLAKQYLGHSVLWREMDAELMEAVAYWIVPDWVPKKVRPYALVLDNLHKVEKAILPVVLSVLNELAERWPNVWVLVQGRAEDPGAEIENRWTGMAEFLPPPPVMPEFNPPKGKRLSRMDRKWNALAQEANALFEGFESAKDAAEHPRCRLELEHIELMSLTKEQVVEQVRRVRPDGMDFDAVSTILKQEQTLRLPLFLMRYLELLAMDAEGQTMPNGSMELLHSYFGLQEYRGGGQELHAALQEYLPWVASRFGREGISAARSETIAGWLRERYGSDVDAEGFLRCAVDELAVMERSGRGRYCFVHDCYQEYFAALCAANSIRQGVLQKRAEPLTTIVWQWSEQEIERCIELCCFAVRDGRMVRSCTESQVLHDLANTLLELRRKELRALDDLITGIHMYITLQGQKDVDLVDLDLLRAWGRIQKRCNSWMTTCVSTLVFPLQAFLQSERFVHLPFRHIIRLRLVAQIGKDGMAEYELAVRYREGLGVRANLKKADEYLERAIEKGCPPAIHARAEAEEEDGRYGRAAEFYQKAVDLWYPPAMWRLGRLYLHGCGVEVNHFRAFDLVERAAEYNDKMAQYYCGQMLEMGIGCIENQQEALRWYDQAAAQGVMDARISAANRRAGNPFVLKDPFFFTSPKIHN